MHRYLVLLSLLLSSLLIAPAVADCVKGDRTYRDSWFRVYYCNSWVPTLGCQDCAKTLTLGGVGIVVGIIVVSLLLIAVVIRLCFWGIFLTCCCAQIAPNEVVITEQPLLYNAHPTYAPSYTAYHAQPDYEAPK